MIFVATPLVQFKRVEDFLADLDAGHVVGVWHECLKMDAYLPRYCSVVRALVLEADGAHRSFVYEHPILVDAEMGRVTDEGRVAEYSRREHGDVTLDLGVRLAEMGIQSSWYPFREKRR